MDWSENFRWNKHASFLASPICIGQTQGGGDKTYKKRQPKKKKKEEAKTFPLGSPALTSWGCTFLCLRDKTLSCNSAITLVHRCKSLQWWDRTEETTHSPDISFESYERKISWGLSTNLLPTLPSMLIWEKSLNNNELLIQKVCMWTCMLMQVILKMQIWNLLVLSTVSLRSYICRNCIGLSDKIK